MESEKFDGMSAAMKVGTPWLASEDIMDAGDVPVQIEAVYKHKDVMFDDGRTATVFSLAFAGKQKQLVLNATNRKTLVANFGTTKVSEWIGQTVVLYVDRNVRKPGGRRGETTCGIRIRAN